MRELVVLSGKGGSGKTSVLSGFAAIPGEKILCDADVDAADLHLILNPEILETHDFVSGNTAVVNPEKCTGCGRCRELCRFSAIDEQFRIDPLECEGCGVCVHFCPEKAIDFPENNCGQWFLSDTRFGPMAHARLAIAEENSGKLVSLVRREAEKLAEEKDIKLILTDGPPGVGCPVIASLGGATAVLIVSEPTVSGIHDMKRVVELCEFFGIPAWLAVNKFDLNLDQTKMIEAYAAEKGAKLMGRVPFDSTFTKAMVEGLTVQEYDPKSGAAVAVSELWKTLEQALMSLPEKL
ncbi:MAG: 4Fe-4S binding protein [Desulfatiglandaceae bacterium]